METSNGGDWPAEGIMKAKLCNQLHEKQIDDASCGKTSWGSVGISPLHGCSSIFYIRFAQSARREEVRRVVSARRILPEAVNVEGRKASQGEYSAIRRSNISHKSDADGEFTLSTYIACSAYSLISHRGADNTAVRSYSFATNPIGRVHYVRP